MRSAPARTNQRANTWVRPYRLHQTAVGGLRPAPLVQMFGIPVGTTLAVVRAARTNPRKTHPLVGDGVLDIPHGLHHPPISPTPKKGSSPLQLAHCNPAQVRNLSILYTILYTMLRHDNTTPAHHPYFISQAIILSAALSSGQRSSRLLQPTALCYGSPTAPR